MTGTGLYRAANALFLDRDGVLNVRPGSGYVTSPKDFHWIDGSLEGLRMLGAIFQYILVVTNQQGVAKGLMTHDQLHQVHDKMIADVLQAGARIDGVYAATGPRHGDSFRRKPAPGMLPDVLCDFPALRPGDAWMAGDTFRDMLYGKRLGMRTAMISDKTEYPPSYGHLSDLRFATLYDFATFMYRKYKTNEPVAGYPGQV